MHFVPHVITRLPHMSEPIQIGGTLLFRKDNDMEIYNKYKIEHTDGTPLKGKQYFVLRLDSDDPVESARVAKAMRAYQERPRNCDVGTAEEKEKRFESFCSFHHLPEGKGCYSCPAIPAKSPLAFHRDACKANWLQMPFQEGETDEN